MNMQGGRHEPFFLAVPATDHNQASSKWFRGISHKQILEDTTIKTMTEIDNQATILEPKEIASLEIYDKMLGWQEPSNTA